MARVDLTLGILLGVALGIAIVAVFVFVFSGETIDAAEIDAPPPQVERRAQP